MGCKFICDLQRHLGGIAIQHVHYDVLGKTVTGTEFKLPEYTRKKVDGYYIDDQGRRVVIEFLGNVYHGHPSLWGPDEQNRNHFGTLHKDNFVHTERVFRIVTSLGYVVRYAWQKDYLALKALQSPLSILREFSGNLEY